MSKENNLTDFLIDIAGAIREKKRTADLIDAQEFSNEIRSITVSVDKPEQIKTVTPSTSQQVVTPDDGYELTNVTVEAVTNAIDTNITATNIRSGVTILGVEGSLEADKPDQTKTVTPSTSKQTVTADTGYELASVTVEAVDPSDYHKPEETKTITPTTSTQTVTPSEGKVFNQVTVDAIPNNYIIPTGELAITENGTHDVSQYASASVDVDTGVTVLELTSESELPATAEEGTIAIVQRIGGHTVTLNTLSMEGEPVYYNITNMNSTNVSDGTWVEVVSSSTPSVIENVTQIKFYMGVGSIDFGYISTDLGGLNKIVSGSGSLYSDPISITEDTTFYAYYIWD